MLVLFIFPPRDIVLAFPAIITGMGPVEFPFKVFVLGDLPGVQFLLAQEPFVHELVYKPIVEVNPHGRLCGPVVTVVILDNGFLFDFAGDTDKRKQADSARTVLI